MTGTSLILTALLLLFLSQSAGAGVTVTVRFVYYNNPNGWNANGQQCDLFGNPCDPLFTITTTMPDGFYNQVVTDRASDQNAVSFGDKIVNINNPLVYTGDKYFGSFTMKVRVQDYDPIGPWEDMGTFSYTHSDPAVPNARAQTAKQVTLVDNGKAAATLTLQISIVCGLNYYSGDCSKQCTPANDNTLGHFTCDSNGNQVCLPSYTQATACRQTYCTQLAPCQNGGRCSDLDNGFVCSCTGLWGGSTCSNPVSACDTGGALCRNNGTCVSGTGASGCVCTTGYTGSECSTDVNECAGVLSVCGHNSTCDNQPGTYSCRCVPGWTGKNCSDDVNECTAATSASPACFNGGFCINQPGNYSCVCPKGFHGDRCELDVDECADNSTSTNCRSPAQVCQNLQGGFICLCGQGWAGANCTVQYVTQEAADAAASSRLLAGVLTPTLLLVVLVAISAGVAAYCCLRRREKSRAWLRRLGFGDRAPPDGAQASAAAGTSSVITENAAYTFPRRSQEIYSVYEDADGQYSKVREPRQSPDYGFDCIGSAAQPSSSTSSDIPVVAPPLPPKRIVPPPKDNGSSDCRVCAPAEYSLISDASSNCLANLDESPRTNETVTTGRKTGRSTEI